MASGDDQVEVREAEVTKTGADALMIVVPMVLFGAVTFGLAYAMYAPSNADKEHLALLEKDAKAYQHVKDAPKHNARCVIVDTQLSIETMSKTVPEYSTFYYSSSSEIQKTHDKHVLMTKVFEEQTLKCRSTVRETTQEVQ